MSSATRPTADETFSWSCDALAVINAVDALRFALPLRLPYSLPTGTAPDRDAADPVKLLEKAWAHLEGMPDDLDNLQLLLARFEVADALGAVRTHDA